MAPIASRLVRLAIGSSSEDEFARCPAAYTGGRADNLACNAAVTTTGVRSSTVASRLSTEVMPDRQHEDMVQEVLRTAVTAAGQPVASSFEEPLSGAEMSQHQHRGKEDKDRCEPVPLLDQVIRRHPAEPDDDRGRGHGDEGLGQAVWSQDRSGQHRGEKDE